MYNDLELNVLKKILNINNETFAVLNEQLDSSEIQNREITSSWFFCKISVDKSITQPIKNMSDRIIFWDVLCNVDKKVYMWFLLYIENWYISLLEWYTFDDDFTQFDSKNYELSYELLNERKIPSELLWND